MHLNNTLSKLLNGICNVYHSILKTTDNHNFSDKSRCFFTQQFCAVCYAY